MRGFGFKSRRRILDGIDNFTLICCKNCIDACMKRPKKRPGLATHFFKKNGSHFLTELHGHSRVHARREGERLQDRGLCDAPRHHEVQAEGQGGAG